MHTTVFVLIMVLMRMICRSLRTGFTQQIMVILVMVERLHKGFTKKVIEKVNRYVRKYVYLLLTSQMRERSSAKDAKLSL